MGRFLTDIWNMLLNPPIQPKDILIRNEIDSLLSTLCGLEDNFHYAMSNIEFLETRKKISTEIKTVHGRFKELENIRNKTGG